MVVNEAGPVSRRWVGGCKALAGVLGLALAVLASPAGAVTYTVTTASDTVSSDSQCSLREAIQEANNGSDTDCGGSPSSGNDLIVFHPSVTTITLGSSLPPIVSGQGTLTIDGGGNVTISGNNSVRVMVVNSGADLTLRNLTIERGNASPGGGALNDGTLRIENSTFRQNTASIFGGGVRNNGTLTITNSIFSENSADVVGGGVENRGTLTITGSTFSGNSADSGGGVWNESGSTLTITNSTFSGNSAGFDGGGVRNLSGTLTITNSTFSGNNVGRDGGGVWSGRFNPSDPFPTLEVYNSTFSENQAGRSGGGLRIAEGDATLRNTIVANSTGGGDCVGSLTGSNLNNLIEDTGANACGLTDGVDGNIIGQDPQLDPLFGSPAYFPLRLGSPARDAGDPTTCQDPPVNNRSQNGIPRPQDGDGNGVPVCDIGSFEALGLLADMRALGGMVPAVLEPGGSYSLSFSCVNLGPDPASQATCGVSVSAGSVSAVNCMPSVPTTSPLIPRWFISCTFTYTAPGMPGGSDTPQTGAVFTFTAGSVTSDPNTNNNTLTSATVPLVDALDDAVSLPGGIIGATFDVGANDQLGASSPPAGATYSLQTGTTCSGASIGATSGVATFNVPALATCVVVYRVCVSEACDTAQLVVTGLLPPPRSIPMLGGWALIALGFWAVLLGWWALKRHPSPASVR
jgi:CSLREA domain-containing protein